MCAKVASAGVRGWLDHYPISGFINTAEMEAKQAAIDVACLSDTGPRRLVDNYDHSHGHQGLFDAGDVAGEGGWDVTIWDLLGDDDDHYLLRCFGGFSEGSVAHEAIIKQDDQSRGAKVGQAVLLNLSGQGSGGLSRGLVLCNATISGNGNGTGRNVGATTAGQVFQVVFRVISGTFVSFDLKIQESQNDGAPDAYVDIAGLAQAGINAAGVWRKTTTAATEAWKRLVVENWNGTDALVLVTAGVVAGT